MKLTFYLFDDTIGDFAEVFLSGKLEGEYPFEPVEIRKPDEDIQVFLQRNRPGRPSWIGFFESHCLFGDEEIRNQYNSLVLVLRVPTELDTRYLALTTGFGFLALDRSRIEDDFGLTVTMNTVGTAMLRGMETRDLTTRTQQKKLAASFHGEVWEFPIDPDREVVGMMVGTPDDDEFAAQVSGSDSLSLFRDLHWSQLKELGTSLLTTYRSRGYETKFRFATWQRRVKNRAQRDRLDQLMAEAIANRDTNRISLAIPIADVDRVARSWLDTKRAEDLACTPFDIPTLYSLLDKVAWLNPDLRKLMILHEDADGNVFDRQPLYKHLIFETRLANADGEERAYLFSLGSWYVIDPDHIARINGEAAAIPVWDAAGLLPAMRWNEKSDGSFVLEQEGEYNVRAAEHPDLVCLDRVLFREQLGGQSRIEVCDLLHRDGYFVCVKKYERSSDMSHLFAQAAVSVELFFHSADYRHFTDAAIGPAWKAPFDPDNDRPTGLKLVLAIAYPEGKQLPEDLPFFSKANLVKLKKLVRPFGFELYLATIPYPRIPHPLQARPRRRVRVAAPANDVAGQQTLAFPEA